MSKPLSFNLKRIAVGAILYFLCLGLGVLLNAIVDRNGNMFYAPAFSAIFSGILYFQYLLKKPFFGLITLTSGLVSFFFLTSGHFWATILPYWLFALLADGMAMSGQYQSDWKNNFSFVFFSLTTTGPILFMWLAPKAYETMLLERGKDMTYVNRVMVAQDWQTILFFWTLTLLGAILGIWLGKTLQVSHFKKKN
ncbi:MptD family putative ECF transporter S component [Streptococcus halotolerans]|uniref:MptD family putative ECF transporter S component n=1 Tax=Streptococcus halotolerans TaxID=1814128 RepID=UPI00078862FA|nr:MptD family putative ECF transporter S component [Streptococcus halotolerans]